MNYMISASTTPMNMSEIAALLQQTLDPNSRKSAEAELHKIQSADRFPISLLELVQDAQMNENVRFSAVLLFKNFIKKYWDPSKDDSVPISNVSREFIKANIVKLMISMPPKLQGQLSEAVAAIADCDFPHDWENLLQDLISKLNLEDHQVNIGVLQTAHSIFKRWRSQIRSDGLFLEIKFVLEIFASPYLQFLKVIDQQIDLHLSNASTLNQLYQVLLLCVKIFYSLICQDLPEFVEDNLTCFMSLWKKYLSFNNDLLASDDDDEAGLLEKVKTGICEIVDLFAKRYEEEFKDLPVFVESIWSLLTTTGLQIKNDLLVSKAMAFLTSVVRQDRHKNLFENPDVLRNICSKVVLPNIELRETDIELFEDDPVEYIRRDLEGSDNDTRRRAATDLIRGLNTHFTSQVTQIFGDYIVVYLQNYEKNKQSNWKAKDAAFYLMIAVSATGTTSLYGATDINPFISVDKVFQENILPDLENVSKQNIHPIIIVDSIKYALTFRSKLAAINDALSVVMNYLSSEHFIVYTYAAICIERMLATKIGNVYLIPPEEVQKVAQPLLNSLFVILERFGTESQKLSENDHVMRAVLRVLIMNQEKSVPFVIQLIRQLTSILSVIGTNPSNPKFNHYVFESIATLIRFMPSENVQHVETFLFPPFQAILQADIPEFMPYVFQILSQLLDQHKAGDVPEMFKAMVVPLTQPTLWQSTGNIPALTKLLQSYTEKGAQTILVGQNHLTSFLGVCQKLLSSKANDHLGLDLLFSILQFVPSEALTQYLQNVFLLLLNRLSGSKTSKFSRGFTTFLSGLFLLRKAKLCPDEVIRLIDTMQPRLFFNLLQHVVLPELKSVATEKERKVTALGLTVLLTESEELQKDGDSWKCTLESILQLLDKALTEKVVSADQQQVDVLQLADLEEDQEAASYQNVFAKLAVIDDDKNHVVNMAKAISNVKVEVLKKLATKNQMVQGKVDA